jgi:hypothetical protein
MLDARGERQEYVILWAFLRRRSGLGSCPCDSCAGEIALRHGGRT